MSFLLVPFFLRVGKRFLVLCALVLILQALIVVLGFLLHAAADFEGPSGSAFENIVYGATPLASPGTGAARRAANMNGTQTQD